MKFKVGDLVELAPGALGRYPSWRPCDVPLYGRISAVYPRRMVCNVVHWYYSPNDVAMWLYTDSELQLSVLNLSDDRLGLVKEQHAH